MILSIIIGSVVWFILVAILNKKFPKVFGSGWSRFISWLIIVVVAIIMRTPVSSEPTEKELNREAKRIEGAWKMSDGNESVNIGIHVLSDSEKNEEYDNRVEAELYGEGSSVDEEPNSYMYFYPKDNEIVIMRPGYDEHWGTYKIKGFFKKRIELRFDTGDYELTRKSKNWKRYLN